MSRSAPAAEDGHVHCTAPIREAVSAPAIGKLQTVDGLTTILRGRTVIAELAVGCPVYEGDVIETGSDGLIAIAFVDGTTFHLQPDTCVVLDQFICGGKKSSNSALLRVVKGVFGFIAGKVASRGRLLIDTPLGQIRSTAAAAGMGSLSLGIFTVLLVRELKAASADIALLDDEKIDYKDLKHGVFEIVTKGDRPEVLTVDDPARKTILRHDGPGISVQEVSLTPDELTRSQHDYRTAYETYLQGLQDPDLQKWQHADIQSTGTSGSSDPNSILGLNNLNTPPYQAAFNTGFTPTSNNGSSQLVDTSLFVEPPLVPPPTTTIVVWISPLSGESFQMGSDWNIGAVPNATDLVEIFVPTATPPLPLPFTVILDQSASVGGLVLGPGVILDVEGGAVLTVQKGISGAGTLELDDPTLAINGTVTLSGGGKIDMLGLAAANVISGVPLTAATLINISDTIEGTGTIGHSGDGALTLVNQKTGTIDATPLQTGDLGLLIIGTGNVVGNSGLMEATNGGILQLDDTLFNIGTLLATSLGELDIKSTTVANSGGTIQIDTSSKLLVDNAHLTLNGDGTGTVTLAGTALITGAAKTDELENSNNVISGTGTISNLTLVNDNGATIDATGLLALSTGNAIANAGLLEATAGGTLDIQDNVNNSGLLEASGGSTLDITGSTIGWVGAAAGIAGTNGILLAGSGDTLLVNVGGPGKTLTLNGSTAKGAVSLGAGSQIVATTAGETLDNVNNVITGDGTIGNNNADLTLKNETAGIIDANDKTLTIETGNAIANAGLLEATAGGTLDIQDNVNNSGLLEASGGSTLDITGSTIGWVGAAAGIAGTNGILLAGSGDTLLVNVGGPGKTLTLNGSTAKGAVSLGAGSQIVATTAGETLDNVNNVITGDGTIGNNNADLTLKNETAGIIDANDKTLTIETGNAIANAGLLEATAGGTLDIQDNVNNSGLLEASGGSTLDITGSTIGWVGAAAGIAGTNGILLAGSGDTLLVNVGGPGKTLTLNGSTAKGAVSLGAGSQIVATTAGETLDNVNNVITGDGTIGNNNADLTLKNETAGIIDANDKTLTIETGNAIANAGLLEATAGGTLDIQDNVNNSGLLEASGGSTLDITGSTIGWVGAAAGIAGTNGILLAGSGDTLLVNVGGPGKTLTLNGSTAKGAVSLGAGSQIVATTAGETLDNVNNVITGDGTIGNNNADLTLKNETAGIIDANDKTLTIETGNAIANAGLLEATAGGTLDIQDNVNNSGLLEASGGSTLDITGSTIGWVGAAAGIAGTNGILLAGSGDTLLVNVGGPGKTLTLNGSTAKGAVSLGAGSQIVATTAGETLDNVNNVITGDGTIGNNNADLTLKNETAGIIDANDKTLTIETGNAIANAGLLEATAGGTLDIQDNVNNSGLLEASGGSTLDITGSTIGWVGAAAGIAGTNGILLAGSGDTLLVNVGGPGKTLTLNGSTAKGAVSLGAGSQIVATTAGETLDNVNNVITGDGTIGNNNADLTLKNETAGIIDANDKTLTIETGNAIANAGLLEATAGGTLDIQDNVNNSGLLEASGGSTLDITGSTIGWVGAAAGIAGTNGILLAGSGDTLLVNVGGPGKTLTLNGSTAKGAVSLGAGSQIVATTAGETLDNVNNVITGDGTIGNNNADLTLKNETAGIIDANDKTLTIETGNAIANAGLLEATAGGTLDIQDNVNNSGLLEASGGSTLDITGSTIGWVGAAAGIAGTNGILLAGSGDTLLVNVGGPGKTLTLNGSTAKGAVSLGAGSQIVATTAGETLDNVNNVITGDGTIGNNNADLTLKNETAGIIDANDKTLTIETGNAIANAGLLEATAGGTLDIQDNVNNSGLLEASGGSTLDITGSTIGWVGAAAGIAGTNGILLAGSGDTLLVNVGGPGKTLTLNGSTAKGAVSLGAGSQIVATTAGETLDNVNNVITGDGTIGNNNADLTLKNETAGIIDANDKTLTIETGNAIANAGLLEATAGGTLDIQDNVNNSGLLEAFGATIQIDNGLITAGTVTTDSAGTLNLNGTGGLSSGTLDNSGNVNANGTNTLSDETVTNDGAITAAGALTLSNNTTLGNDASTDTITVDKSASLTFDDTSSISGGTVIINSTGTVTFAGTNTATGTAFTDNGTINISGTLTLAGTDTITGGSGSAVSNAGTIYVTGNTTISVASITGSGMDVIDAAGAVLKLNAATDTQAVTFAGNVGTLRLMQPTNFKGAIDGLVVGDVIDLPTVTVTSAVINGSTLVVNNNPALTYSIAGTGSLANDYFAIVSDGVPGGDELVLSQIRGPIIDLNGSGSGDNNTLNDGGSVLPVQIAPSAIITDANSSTLASMTITLTNPQDNSEDSTFGGTNFKEAIYPLDAAAIALATADGLVVTFTAKGNSAETLLITGIASVADYQAILQGVQYTDQKMGSRGSTPRIVDVQANDGTFIGNTPTVTITTTHTPAGVAGAPINLALTDPSGGLATGPIALTVTGVPSDWSLNQGTNLGNGTWTVETNDLSTLTVMTAAAYAGAIVLGVSESWTNADGSTASVSISDNVEAYAPGTPIFALASNDTLTGAGANDEFVFTQQIGNDTIYNFSVATDKIDLMGFASVAGFADIQASTTTDGSGNAVITLGNGETITLHGVDAASLTASDFVFNQMPVLDNAGTMAVSDAAILPLSGIIENSGTISLNSSGNQTYLQVMGDGITLEGGGHLILSGSQDIILGTSSQSTLTNVDNTISGSGQIGIGDGMLTLVNQAQGTIEANGPGGELTIDTGNAISNHGLLEATNGGALLIDDPVNGGSAVIAGGTLDFAAPTSANVIFDNGTGTPLYGDLVLHDASGFSGTIAGFTGTAADAAHSDVVELAGFAESSSSVQTSGGNEILTLLDSSGHAVTLTFADFGASFTIENIGDNTYIYDPPVAGSTQNSSTGTTIGDSSASLTTAGTASSASTQNDHGMTLHNDQIRFSGSTESASNVATESSSAATPLAGIGDDKFMFNATVGDATVHNPAVELIDSGNANVLAQHLTPPSPPITPVEVFYDLAHDDGQAAASQFHQMVASVAHLH